MKSSSSSALTVLLLLANLVGSHGQLCTDGCTIECNSISMVSGNCDKVVELECEGSWDGFLCLDCDDDGDFYFESRIPQDGIVSTRGDDAECDPQGRGTEGALSFYSTTCRNRRGETATFTVYDKDLEEGSGKMSGGGMMSMRRATRKLLQPAEQEQHDREQEEFLADVTRQLRAGKMGGRGGKMRGGKMSGLMSQSCRVAGNSYRRRLTSFDEESLYANLEDQALRESSKKHVSFFDDAHKKDLQPCPVRESKLYQQMATIHDCIDPANRIAPDVMDPHYEENYQPWVIPNPSAIHEGAQITLVAKNPGLWTIDDFLSPSEVETFIEIMMRNGKGQEGSGMFGPCTDVGKNPMTSQPSTNKECYMIGPETMCEGPYHYSACEHATAPTDGEFIKMVQERAQNLMQIQTDVAAPKYHEPLKVSKHIKLHRATGDTPPQLLHEDAYDHVTFMIYLSDGGANTVFPAAHNAPRVAPKKGRAIVWLNHDKDGHGLQSSFHAVEPHEAAYGDRMVAIIPFGKRNDVDQVHDAE